MDSYEDIIREALREYVGDGDGADESVLHSYSNELRYKISQEILTQLLPRINPTQSERFEGMRAGVKYAAEFIVEGPVMGSDE